MIRQRGASERAGYEHLGCVSLTTVFTPCLSFRWLENSNLTSLLCTNITQPSERMRRFAKRSEDQIFDVCEDMAPLLSSRVSSYELYDAVSRLNPELQQALLRLVKEMLRVQEAGFRKPERGGEGQKD